MGELLQIHAKTYMLWKMSRVLNPKYTSIYHYPLNYHYFPKLEEGESVVGMLVLTEAEERDKKYFPFVADCIVTDSVWRRKTIQDSCDKELNHTINLTTLSKFYHHEE